MSKKLFLIAVKEAAPEITFAKRLPSGSGWQIKHNADTVLSTLDSEFKATSRFYVVACADDIEAGGTVDTEKMDICFRLI